ncbi:MAG: DUF4239 domain-containing protein [Candidatus Obscuribacterales bacterium]|jgi:hypothetical protein|nr:DUF4239 domain-containing protein [Candidatus Obscuribacterales bacterium]
MTLAVIIITAVIGITIFGQLVVKRIIHADMLDVHQGLAEAVLGVVGTMFSVLLGLLVAGSIDSYREIRGQVNLEANGVADVFRIARGLSDVDRPRIRSLCREYCNAVIDQEWESMRERRFSDEAQDCYQRLWEAVVAVTPENDRQNNLQEALLSGMQALGENRRIRAVSCSQSLSPALWVAIIFGSIITTTFTYFFTSKLGSIHTLMTGLIALSLGLNVWLLAEYSEPFSGSLQIRPDMFILLRDSFFKAPDTPSRYLKTSVKGAAS